MDIRNIKEAVAQIAGEFSITGTTLFGSQANGTADAKSDVDLIIEFHVPVTLITLSSISLRLEKLLHRHVDVIHGPIQEGDLIQIDKDIEIYNCYCSKV